MKKILENIFTVIVIIVIYIIAIYILKISHVVGTSMEPTYKSNDNVLLFRTKDIKRYDVIIARHIYKGVTKEDEENRKQQLTIFHKFLKDVRSLFLPKKDINDVIIIKRVIGLPDEMLIFDEFNKNRFLVCKINDIISNIGEKNFEKIKNYEIKYLNYDKFRKYCQEMQDELGFNLDITRYYNYYILDKGYFVLGDNRAVSCDSSNHFNNNFEKESNIKQSFINGNYQIYKDEILGKVILKLF